MIGSHVESRPILPHAPFPAWRARGLSTAANVFVGMVEAPLLVRPYLDAMSRGELFMVMTCGMASRPLTLQRMLGWLLAPLAWLTGIPWAEAAIAGVLLGTKTVLNELIAYADLARLGDAELSPRSRPIMTSAASGS